MTTLLDGPAAGATLLIHGGLPDLIRVCRSSASGGWVHTHPSANAGGDGRHYAYRLTSRAGEPAYSLCERQPSQGLMRLAVRWREWVDSEAEIARERMADAMGVTG